MSKGGWIAIAVAAVVVLWGISSYNGVVTARRAIDGAWGQTQVVLQRRADLIPQLVATVSGNASFEKSTLENITAARSGLQQSLQNGTREDQIAAAQKMDQAMYQFRLQVEAYPQLGANKAFQDLQTQIEGTENRIAVERKRYNDSVLDYNTQISVFPRVVIARMFGFMPEKQYTASAANPEQAPQVQFNIK